MRKDRCSGAFLQAFALSFARFPQRVAVAVTRDMSLRYGENPHQNAAFYKLPASGETSVGAAKLSGGSKEISFNNLMDANAAFELVKEFSEPAAVV
ncbi:MAG TPA: hypothetical protein PKM58_08730, partial [Pyrinomonadaceae bacterium]|nr:hypothetical protein [Pyrinomonadaceae bacterium]